MNIILNSNLKVKAYDEMLDKLGTITSLCIGPKNFHFVFDNNKKGSRIEISEEGYFFRKT